MNQPERRRYNSCQKCRERREAMRAAAQRALHRAREAARRVRDEVSH